ncbi:MAG: hypothetical protein U5J63_07195 [Fodinibius sp.]|nr:hypothetical protein [Fodinibius sp.]
MFSLGYHFPLLNEFMFNYMPYFNKFRTPEMWLVVSVFCFSVLAVYGVEALIDIAKNQKKSVNDLLVPMGIALGLGLLFTLGSNALLSFEKEGEAQRYAQQLARQNNLQPDNQRVQQRVDQYINSRLKPERKEMASSDATRYLILALLASGLIVGFLKRKVSKGYFLAGLLLLTAYDMLSVDSRYVDQEKMKADRIETEQLIQRQQTPADKYIMQNINSNQGYPYRVLPLMRNPFNNAIPAYFYPTVGGYTGAKLAIYQDLIDHLLLAGNRGGINEPILDMLNVKYVTAQQQLPFVGYSEVFNQNGQRVYRNNDVLPKAFFVDSVRTVGAPQQAVDLMKPSAGFNPANTAIVETDDQLSSSADTTATVSVSSYKANEIEIQTSSSQQQFLVLSEIYYPVDGRRLSTGSQPRSTKRTLCCAGCRFRPGITPSP